MCALCINCGHSRSSALPVLVHRWSALLSIRALASLMDLALEALEEFVRSIRILSAFSVLTATLAVAACQSNARTAPDGMTADLERDLQLASKVRSSMPQAVSAIELGERGGPSGSSRGTRDAVRTPRRAPSPSPAAQLAQVAVPDLPPADHTPTIATTMTEATQAPAPAPVVEPVAVGAEHGGPYIGTSPEPYGGGGGGGGSNTGDWGRGRGDGRTGTGAIIRGGGPGEDHCEPRGRRMPMGGVGIGGIIGTLGGGGRAPFPRY